MPNPEQAGLLAHGYLGLDGAAGDEALWEQAAQALRTAPADARRQICTVLLNEMRRSLAIDVECFDDDEFDRIRRRSQGSLRAEWAVPDTDQPRAAIVVARPGRAGGARDQVITSDDAQQVIHDLLEVLAAAGLVTRVEDPYRRGTHGYRVRVTGLIWRPGDGTH